jgi:hypothetical protein
MHLFHSGKSRALAMAISPLLFCIGGYMVSFALSDALPPRTETALQRNAAEISEAVTGDRTVLAVIAFLAGMFLALLAPIVFLVAFTAGLVAHYRKMKNTPSDA